MLGNRHPDTVSALALARYRLDERHRALELQERAVMLLPAGDSDLRSRLEEDLVRMAEESL